MHRKKLFLLLALISFSTAHAEISETWTVSGNPTGIDIARWAKIPPPESIRINLYDNAPQIRTLKVLLQSFGISNRQIILSRYPQKADLATWKVLAPLDLELVVNSGYYPSLQDIDVLNQISFKKIHIHVLQYPTERTVDQLLKIQTQVFYHFAVDNRYPNYFERLPISRLPQDSTLTFHVDEWPLYMQMDVWNLIPHSQKRLHVLKTELKKPSIPYTKNLKNMVEIVFQGEGNINQDQWVFLKEHSILWKLNESVPDAKDLDSFKASSPLSRSLQIEQAVLSKNEKDRLMGSLLKVTWIHPAP